LLGVDKEKMSESLVLLIGVVVRVVVEIVKNQKLVQVKQPHDCLVQKFKNRNSIRSPEVDDVKFIRFEELDNNNDKRYKSVKG
ncbi:13073_t:CDS:2, partial [Racocetra fulgida]